MPTEAFGDTGQIDLPDGETRGWALLVHRFENATAERIARAFAAHGIGTLRIEAGDNPAAQIIAAAESLTTADRAPVLIVGHDRGGTAALATAATLPSVKAVATIAAPWDRDHASRIEALRRPLLILHAPFDRSVDIDDATHIFLAARHPKSFVSLDHADHGLSNPVDADHAAATILGWASRYLPAVAETRDDGEADVVAEETGAGRFQVAIRAGGVRFIADEPVTVGGLGSGPTPYDLLSAGLAACTTMTLRLYADQKGWDAGRIRTAAGHAKRKGEMPADLFTRRIELGGDLSDDQRARMLEIADRCPVHRTLEASAKVETQAGPPPAATDPIEAHALAASDLTGAQLDVHE